MDGLGFGLISRIWRSLELHVCVCVYRMKGRGDIEYKISAMWVGELQDRHRSIDNRYMGGNNIRNDRMRCLM